ncbi:hypothetical protein, partial [Yersinia pestis]|uniref:hypothetical protein n=1 Tax=Yersinia pestis TaxID=632 RepID=UPI000E306A52
AFLPLELFRVISVIFQAADALAAFTSPQSLTGVSSWGFTQLPPSCHVNYLGYNVIRGLISRKNSR